ncbi:MAG: hypothetical protein KC621_28995 [Myxococcales bacterium]|nr:hypothetical protein [Myxococcales bacterium]
MNEATTVFERVRAAHADLRGPQPGGLTGKQALDRRTELERTVFDGVRQLGELGTEEARDGLVALLEIGRHDGQLRTRVIGALRQLEVPGVAACAMAKVPDLGVDILDVHRDPAVLPTLIAMIDDGEQAMPRHWCLAVCAAASLGHAPSRERLAELFGNPSGLDRVSWLLPMLRVLLAGGAADTWDFTEPVRTALVDLERPAQGWQHKLLSALARTRDPDPRWADLALASLGPHSNSFDAALLATRLGRQDADIRDRLLATGSPMALHALAEAGDTRARQPLTDRLTDPDLHTPRELHRFRLAIRDLFALGDPPREAIEQALVVALTDVDDLGDEELAETLACYEGSFVDPATAPALAELVTTRYLLTDGSQKALARFRKTLAAEITARAPSV